MLCCTDALGLGEVLALGAIPQGSLGRGKGGLGGGRAIALSS